MGPNFSPVIAYNDDQVFAMGPLGSDDLGTPDYVEELRAWIYQPKSFNVNVPGSAQPTALWSPNDAAADSIDQSALRQSPGACWMLPLTPMTAAPFSKGRAFAVAIALISNGPSSGQHQRGSKLGRVIWWGHPIRLIGTTNANTAVKDIYDGLDTSGQYSTSSDEFLGLERRLQDMSGN